MLAPLLVATVIIRLLVTHWCCSARSPSCSSARGWPGSSAHQRRSPGSSGARSSSSAEVQAVPLPGQHALTASSTSTFPVGPWRAPAHHVVEVHARVARGARLAPARSPRPSAGRPASRRTAKAQRPACERTSRSPRGVAAAARIVALTAGRIMLLASSAGRLTGVRHLPVLLRAGGLRRGDERLVDRAPVAVDLRAGGRPPGPSSCWWFFLGLITLVDWSAAVLHFPRRCAARSTPGRRAPSPATPPGAPLERVRRSSCPPPLLAPALGLARVVVPCGSTATLTLSFLDLGRAEALGAPARPRRRTPTRRCRPSTWVRGVPCGQRLDAVARPTAPHPSQCSRCPTSSCSSRRSSARPYVLSTLILFG